jgi:hypothetical protein
VFHYNYLGLEQYSIKAAEVIDPGQATIRFEFNYEGGGPGRGGTGKLLVNGKQVAAGQIAKTQSNTFSTDDTADVGEDGGTPVSPAYKSPESHFTGKLIKATIELK